MSPIRPFLFRTRAHLAAHWHHHATVWGALATLLAFLLGAGTATAYVRAGGYHRGPLPPRISISSSIGGALPASASLTPFIARIHNQGISNSCVGQTGATITEITTAERRAAHHRASRPWFSAGYIYDQINGGSDNGSSYNDAFAVLRTQGDARLKAFPHDGIDWWVQPDDYARTHALQHRITSWRSIDPSDRYTMSYELTHGRPIAIAIPVTDSFYDNWLQSSIVTVTGQAGAFHFWHSITGVAFNPAGVTILNSWGPRYGSNGLIRLSWSFLASVGAAIVVSTPAQAITVTRPSPTATPTRVPTPKPTKTPTTLGTPGPVPTTRTNAAMAGP